MLWYDTIYLFVLFILTRFLPVGSRAEGQGGGCRSSSWPVGRSCWIAADVRWPGLSEMWSGHHTGTDSSGICCCARILFRRLGHHGLHSSRPPALPQLGFHSCENDQRLRHAGCHTVLTGAHFLQGPPPSLHNRLTKQKEHFLWWLLNMLTVQMYYSNFQKCMKSFETTISPLPLKSAEVALIIRLIVTSIVTFDKLNTSLKIVFILLTFFFLSFFVG